MSNISTITALFEKINTMISEIKEADKQHDVTLKKLSETMTKLAKAINIAFENQRELRDILNRELPLCKKPKHQTEVYVMYILLTMSLVMNLCIYVRLL